MGASANQWTLPTEVAKREPATPRKALASASQRIARSGVTTRQRAVGGAQRSEEDEQNARGSTNLSRKWQGMATGNVRRNTAKP